MLESGDVLLTWQLARRPLGDETLPMAARRIGDHRIRYLDYEGPISGDRGTVTRMDRGELTITGHEAGMVCFTLRGSGLTGDFSLRRAGSHWILDRAGE